LLHSLFNLPPITHINLFLLFSFVKAKQAKKGAKKRRLSPPRKIHASVRPRAKSKPKKSKKFEDPLEIAMPPKWLGVPACKQIVGLKKFQYRLWGWTLALAIILLLSITSLDLLSDFQILPEISQAHHNVMANGDILAIFIISLELAQGFSHAKNKVVYIKENWLAILAILPIGLFVRVARSFEGLILLEELANLRAFQVAGKFGELRSILPVLELPYELRFLSFEVFALRTGSILRATSSAIFGFGSSVGDALRSMLGFLR